MKYIVANLKSHKELSSMTEYNEQLNKLPKLPVNLIICPSYPFIPVLKPINYVIGAQDVSVFNEGSYTGEVNAKQLKSLGVSYVIVGHSERRNYFQENEKIIITKIKNAFRNGLEVIFCIGENLNEYQDNATEKVLEKQLATVLNEFTREEIKNIIIAYEPLWAIGSGQIPSKSEVEKNVQFIKNIINNYYELELPVIYGGSVNINNIDTIKEISVLNGFIAGDSALDLANFKQLVDIYLS